jgi:CheY-like chemotaxis protein
MTANAMAGDKEKCLRCGMDEYVSKPINIDELTEVLGQWIHFKDFPKKLLPVEAIPEKGSAENGKDKESSPDGDAPLDLSILKTFSEGDVEMEKQFIGVFVNQSDKNLKVLAENRVNTGAAAWRDTAHMFKGGSSGIGAKVLAGLCSEAQNFSGAAPEQAALFEKINSEYANVKDHLKKMGLLS